MVVALVAVGTSSHVIGRPVFWLDDQRWTILGAIVLAVVIALPIGTLLVLCSISGPWVPHVSVIVTVELMLLAVLDRHRSPGSAMVLAGLAGAALLMTASAFAVRVRSNEPPRIS